MHGVWRVGSFPDEVWIARAFGGALPAGATLISPAQAAWWVEEWFPEGGRARQVLAEIHEDLGSPTLTCPALGLEALRSRVRQALRDGSLRAFRIAVKLSGAPVNVEPSKPKDIESPLEKKTWIGIELMDDSDPPKPVPFKKYRIELPDQSIREGMLDGNGQARVVGFDPGSCKVSFPQLHGPDWDKA
jgi:hypothetical protein